jgi:hypothetical protein
VIRLKDKKSIHIQINYDFTLTGYSDKHFKDIDLANDFISLLLNQGKDFKVSFLTR